MRPLDSDVKVGVVGAGAMGAGIAQVAATYGHQVVLYDTSNEVLSAARSTISKNLARSVEKNRITRNDAAGIIERITTSGGLPPGVSPLDMFEGCGLVIEAIVEDLSMKRELFARLEQAARDDAILATNTSSLSVTAIARACKRPERVLGVHFFNPAPVLPLVEIVPGLATEPEVTLTTRALVDAWGKTTVVAKDTPGFIVNRIARPFYGEALRMYEEGIANFATVDWAVRELGGFRMGPFELMDFIGNDVNFAATCAVYEGTFHDSRYRPTVTQQRLVQAGYLGRKSGRGYYDYSAGAEKPEPAKDPVLGRAILDRIVALLINEAAEAVNYGIASGPDVELAMTRGVNYPKGLLAWADELGLGVVVSQLEALQSSYGEERYRVSPLLRRMAREGLRFFPEDEKLVGTGDYTLQ